ncbi:RagB/SusD family nutrient uptake outer membrane protein [Paraflavisolibacter sp. H34]|uniref:RagB/SusD family nutrient uptake outer membrane protein n=1 Tax=Huijunlia imazamoxiresistens TaxID=3127457 RepID=UPI0030196F5F
MKLGAVLLAALVTITSCKKDFLNEQVESSYTPEALKDSLSFESALAGIQIQYGLWHTLQQDNVTSQGFLAAWQVGTDVAYNKSVADIDPYMVPYINYEKLTPADPVALFTWKWAYNVINNCNIVLAQVDNARMGGANKASIKAEASFFRAYAYNTLATLFGGVPLLTQPVSGPKTDGVRAPLAEVNSLILSDLAFAKANLPAIGQVKSNPAGRMYARPNKAMPSQLLAEVYLRTGEPAKAEQEADAVIGSGDFSLTTGRYGIKASQPGDPFSDMFHYGNQRRSQGNREAIWVHEMESSSVVNGGTGPTSSALFPGYIFGAPQHRRVWVPRYYNQRGMVIADTLGGRGIARMALTPFVLNNLYEPTDMRNSQYNIRRKFYYNDPSGANYGKEVVPGPGIDTNTAILPYTTKWNSYDPTAPLGGGGFKDVIVMRLGETYLLKAEAQFKQGKLPEAAATLNVLRARANAAPISATQVTMDFILDERARELLAEENRRMTLIRTGTLLNRVVGRGMKITGLESKHLLLPVPLTEIQLNKDAVLDQNPGYN